MLKRSIACTALLFLGIGMLIPSVGWSQDEPIAEEELPEEEFVEEEGMEEELPEEEYEEEPAGQPGSTTTRPGSSTTRPTRPGATAPRVITRPSPITPPSVRQPARPPAGGGAKMSATAGVTNLAPGSTPGEDVMFNYNDEPLIDVIQHIAKLTGRNFDIDPNIGATTVTIITHDKLPPEMAMEVLESILNARGYSLVENLDGQIIRVVPTTDAPGSAMTPLEVDITSDNIPEGYDTFSTHIVPIKYADPSEIMTALQKLGSKSASMDTYLPTNTLIITDTANGLRRMLKFIEIADVPGNDTSMEIFTLEYTRAEVLATQLEQVLLDSEGGQAAPTSGTRTVRPTTRPTRPTTRTIPGAETAEVIGTNLEVLRMVPDERLNSLIVVATSGMMEQVRDLVIRLDSPTPYENNTFHIYELLNADAELMEQALQPLVGTAPRRQEGGGGGGGGAAATQTAEVQPFEQRVQITRYDQTNSLLIVASPQDYKLLEAYIARLDVPQRQVHVKASVMDVNINDAYNLSVNAASIGGSDGFALTDTSLLPVTDLATALTSPETAGVGLLSGVLGLGGQGGISTGIFDDITVEIGGRDFDIPFVPVLFQALETLSDLEVLSQPSLTTIDNEESSITVGKEVPFITGSSRPQTTTGGTDNVATFGTTRIQREDVGVKLMVTPQISEGDNVLLEIEIEVSDIADTDPRVGTPDIVGPTTNKSLFTNKVLVKDGSTAVLAGLIRDSTNRTRNQTPILGDVPGLGWLFRSKRDSRQKSNLVVLVTPHIVKEGVDMERLTLHKLNEYHDANLQELFEQGFFKRIKKKYDRRKDHRPTFEDSAAITGRDTGGRKSSAFRRGDMKR